MLYLILLLLMTTAALSQTPPIEPGVSQELAKWRTAHYSDVRYKLDLTIEKMSPVLKGKMEIRVNVRDAAIILDWRKIKGHEDKSTISNVSINGRVLSSAGRRPDAITSNAEGNLQKPPEGGTQNEKPPEGGTQNAFDVHNEHLVFRDGVVVGENVIKLDFTSPILLSGSAITRYVDKEDGSEYIYSLFVPSDASSAFPVFDQPDLKGKFTLSVYHPEGWEVITNSRGESGTETRSWDKGTFFWSRFVETKPISSYVFAFAAGPFARVEVPPSATSRNVKPELKEAFKKWLNTDVSYKLDGTAVEEMRRRRNEELSRNIPSDSRDFSRVYVRKSQLAKFQPHAAEVFRLNSEGVKFLEEYFAYKFPFPKYDLVLIPEFPFGGMEHAGATFLRESAVIFPSEPTANDHISRANLIFHEAAHQWFGDTVTMRWFDDLWLKEGFAEFMAYKTLERVMPQYNAWKAFYERNKPLAYQTDSTRGTTAIYQEIKNLNSAKSAYGNIVYRKAPSFLKQAEFYLGPDKFQTAVRAFLKKYEFANAGWVDLVTEFANQRAVSRAGNEKNIRLFSNTWVTKRGLKLISTSFRVDEGSRFPYLLTHGSSSEFEGLENLSMEFECLVIYGDGSRGIENVSLRWEISSIDVIHRLKSKPLAVIANHKDYGYGIFLLDDESRDYVLKNIQNEKDDFLRSMMWGALWDSVREAELDPREYVELAIKNIGVEKDELTIQTILGRVSTAMTYYVSERPAVTGASTVLDASGCEMEKLLPSHSDLRCRLETLLVDKMRNAPTLGQRVTYYRAFLNIASTEKARSVLKHILNLKFQISDLKLKTKDRFDIVTKLASLNDPDADRLLTELEKTETSDDAKRYAYAARSAFPTKENKEKFWNDFVGNKSISESWIEAAFGPFNSVRHSDLTLPYLERALKELPNHKRNRKIFFVNGWLSAFIGGQKSEEALAIVNKFLTDNPNLDRDLRLKILENVDVIERAVKIRGKFATR